MLNLQAQDATFWVKFYDLKQDVYNHEAKAALKDMKTGKRQIQQRPRFMGYGG